MNDGSATMWALLVGIDCYMPNATANGMYAHLHGCVSDVRRIERFLESKRAALNLAQIFTLTASGQGSQPTEPPEQWPTYANLVAAFTTLRDRARSGDQVYIHVSSHGCRAKTIFPDLKSAGGYDEGLVPTDIGSSGHYLRDVELAYLLQQLVDRHLLVTMTLDTCHSGGAVRAVGVRKRGPDQPDERDALPQDSLVASREELVSLWQQLQGGPVGTHNVKQAGGWLPPQAGYTLFAACGEADFANEYTDDDGVATGALTKFFLEGCQRLGPGFTNKLLLDRILTGIHGRYPYQTPQLQGDGARVVFGVERITMPEAIAVLKVEAQRVLLNTGQASGVTTDATFAIYPPATLDFGQSATRVALATITELGATNSWANVTLVEGRTIAPAAQAILLNPGSLDLVRTVRFVVQVGQTCAATADEQRVRLDEVSAALQQNPGRAWIACVTERASDFQVALSREGTHYAIWDCAGVEIPLRPEDAVGDPDAAAKVVQRLIHLAKYRNVQELRNYDTTSMLEGKLHLELLGKQAGYTKGAKPNLVAFADPNQPAVQHDEFVFVRLTNKLPPVNDPRRPWLNTLNVTLFDLAPDWSISQLFPADDSPSYTISPGLSRDIPLRMWLPDGYNQGLDILKVFATEGSHTTSFRWFALPALDKPTEAQISRARSAAATSSNTLDRMLASVAGEVMVMRNTRNATVSASPSDHWVTAQVELHIAR